MCDTHLIDALRNIRDQEQLNRELWIEAYGHSYDNNLKDIKAPDYLEISPGLGGRNKMLGQLQKEKKTLRVHSRL